MHSSELQIPEEIAQKISSYGGRLFNCEELGGMVEAQAIYMHFNMTECEDDKLIFQVVDEIVKETRQVQ